MILKLGMELSKRKLISTIDFLELRKPSMFNKAETELQQIASQFSIFNLFLKEASSVEDDPVKIHKIVTCGVLAYFLSSLKDYVKNMPVISMLGETY